jgi:hypothetical protein
MRVFTPVPAFAEEYPNRAENITHTRLPFYCINCQGKAATCYLTPNFGPLCAECLKEIPEVTAPQEPWQPQKLKAARAAITTLRDAARAGGLDFRTRDNLVMLLHEAVDALDTRNE